MYILLIPYDGKVIGVFLGDKFGRHTHLTIGNQAISWSAEQSSGLMHDSENCHYTIKSVYNTDYAGEFETAPASISVLVCISY